ncbi:MAG TPA: hypothetical protein VFQ53_15845 [Kofleriaceae bacterium]|nr:hypothetical protein [Kofleriaceae bacterium]
MPTPDERLRAAQAAIAEREHLLRVRAQLASQLATQDQRVQQLTLEHRREQADVDRLGKGVIAFLNDLLGGQLAREQREAYEALVRLQEAAAMRDALRRQIESLDTRVSQLASAEADLEAARTDKEADLRRSGAPIAADLQELDIQIMSIDIELVPLHEAVVAGHAALAGLAVLVQMLNDASAGVETKKRDAKGIAGDAEAKLKIFETEMADLAPLPLDIPAADPADVELDDWLSALLKDGDRTRRLAAASADLTGRIARLRARLEPVRARHDELSARRQRIVESRAMLVMRT